MVRSGMDDGGVPVLRGYDLEAVVKRKRYAVHLQVTTYMVMEVEATTRRHAFERAEHRVISETAEDALNDTMISCAMIQELPDRDGEPSA